LRGHLHIGSANRPGGPGLSNAKEGAEQDER
jgi:hypothetical protein